MTFEEELAADAAYMKPLSSDGQLIELRQHGQVLLELDRTIQRTEERLAELKRQKLELEQRTLPDMMDAAGVDRVGLADSAMDMVVKPYYKAVLPEERSEEAGDWLDQNGHGDLMRTVLSVEFGPGEHEHATNVETLIRSYFRGRNDIQREPVKKRTVHWKTLTSFVKEQLTRGEVLPLDILGATVGRVAKITPRKGK